MVPFGATTKSPLNSGFRQTTIRTESPGDNTPRSLEAAGCWADTEPERTKRTRRVRETRMRIDLGEPK
jgi:hypothetical protein